MAWYSIARYNIAQGLGAGRGAVALRRQGADVLYLFCMYPQLTVYSPETIDLPRTKGTRRGKNTSWGNCKVRTDMNNLISCLNI